MKKLLSYIRRGCDDYNMISDGDRIAVGVSAGKDSLALLAGLAAMRRFYPKKYEVIAITIDMGFPGADFSSVAAFCEKLDVEYHVVKTEIQKIIFEFRKEKNPCSLCAKMRRGALHDAAKSFGCNKVALGHHFDDVVDTFMLNLFFEGRIGTFSPVTYLSNTDLYLIRPMLYMPEKEVVYFQNRFGLPVIKSPCPADKNTQRETMKQLLAREEKLNRGLKYRIFGAITRAGIDGFKVPEKLGGMKEYSE